jgi:cyclopropane fatty-acyl-phospholipid synthase-like methyltransferase
MKRRYRDRRSNRIGEDNMQAFYEDFYSRVASSLAHADFCERVFGKNLCQHGFADMAQLDMLLKVMQLETGQHALDLGCGNGMISEYLSDCTGAHVMGLDYIPQAVELARERTRDKSNRLQFVVGNINALDLPPASFDAIISIDSLYFSEDYTRTVGDLLRLLKPGGQMGILFAHGPEPWTPREEFDAESIAPDRTPLGVALKAHNLPFRTWDFTADDERLAHLRQQVLAELHPRFEAEGIGFIYENRMGDAQGISQVIAEGLHKRYLYHVTPIHT